MSQFYIDYLKKELQEFKKNQLILKIIPYRLIKNKIILNFNLINYYVNL